MFHGSVKKPVFKRLVLKSENYRQKSLKNFRKNLKKGIDK